MGRKRSSSDEGNTSKYTRKVLPLVEKLKVLDKLKEGKGSCAVGRMFGISESTVRSIKFKEKEIRKCVASSLHPSAKVGKIRQDMLMWEMEKALFLWLQEKIQERVPATSQLLRERAVELYQSLLQEEGRPCSETRLEFQASKGWFDQFCKRFSLRLRDGIRQEGYFPIQPSRVTPPPTTHLLQDATPPARELPQEVTLPSTRQPEAPGVPSQHNEDVTSVVEAVNKHLSSLVEAIANDTAFLNVTLTTHGKSIQAHKVVLAAVSPYFREVLEANPYEHPTIVLPDEISFQDLQAVIHFAYKGKVLVSEQQLPSIIKAANLLKISALSGLGILDKHLEFQSSDSCLTRSGKTQSSATSSAMLAGFQSSATPAGSWSSATSSAMVAGFQSSATPAGSWSSATSPATLTRFQSFASSPTTRSDFGIRRNVEQNSSPSSKQEDNKPLLYCSHNSTTNVTTVIKRKRKLDEKASFSTLNQKIQIGLQPQTSKNKCNEEDLQEVPWEIPVVTVEDDDSDSVEEEQTQVTTPAVSKPHPKKQRLEAKGNDFSGNDSSKIKKPFAKSEEVDARKKQDLQCLPESLVSYKKDLLKKNILEKRAQLKNELQVEIDKEMSVALLQLQMLKKNKLEAPLTSQTISPRKTKAEVSDGTQDKQHLIKKENDLKRNYRVGKKSTKYTMQDKDKVIKLLDKGTKTCDIVRLTGFPESTIRSIKNKKGDIEVCLNTAKKFFSGNVKATSRVMNITTQSNHLRAVTEFYLDKWIQRHKKKQASIEGHQIREQARILYAALAKKKNIAQPQPFIASKGWLHEFKSRFEGDSNRPLQEFDDMDNILDECDLFAFEGREEGKVEEKGEEAAIHSSHVQSLTGFKGGEEGKAKESKVKEVDGEAAGEGGDRTITHTRSQI